MTPPASLPPFCKLCRPMTEPPAEPGAINAVLHVGGPKCGSSSLQSVLSSAPDLLGADGQRYAYLCLEESGAVTRGQTLRTKARSSVFGYLSSADIAPGADARARFATLGPEISRLSAQGVVPVLSSEGWINRGSLFRNQQLLERAGMTAHVVIFVRPPLDWLNSAWWQWGAWVDVSVERWIAVNTPAAQWAWMINLWKSLPGVAKVSIRLTHSDVVGQFFDLLGLPGGAPQRLNTGLSPDLLYFLRRNRRYRPGPHDSQVEFALSRWMPAQTGGTPWILPPDLVKTTLAKVRPQSGKLLELVDPHEKQLIRTDKRWWTPDAYAGREVPDPATFETPESHARLLADLEAAVAAAGGNLPRSRLRLPARPRAADAQIAGLIDEVLRLDRAFRARTPD